MQVFVCGIPNTKTRIFNVNSLKELISDILVENEFLQDKEWTLFSRGIEAKQLEEELQFYIRTRGGKGGFGSNLKAQGARMNAKKATNFDSCRDLQGRRLKLVNDAKKLADYIESAPERQRLEKEKVQKKIKEGLDQKLQRKFYEDNGYEEKHQQVLNTMENAVAQALKKKKPRKRQVSASSESDSELE